MCVFLFIVVLGLIFLVSKECIVAQNQTLTKLSDPPMKEKTSYHIGRYVITPSEKRIQREISYEETKDVAGERLNVWKTELIDQQIDYNSTAMLINKIDFYLKEFFWGNFDDFDLIDLTASEDEVQMQLQKIRKNDIVIPLALISKIDKETALKINMSVWVDKHNIYCDHYGFKSSDDIEVIPIKALGFPVYIPVDDKWRDDTLS